MTAKTYSRAQLEGFTIAALKKLADLNYSPDDTKGLRKAQLVELLDGHYNPADEVDDEVDDDEEVDDIDAELDDEADDEEDDTPAVKATPPEPTGDTLTAKQVATRLGTDAKTLRKFFRTGASQFKAVGQGGRYEFAKADLPAIKAAFEAYTSGKTPRVKRDPADKAKPTGRMATAELEDDDEIDDEPALEELDDLELDDTELDEDLELDDEEDD
jgi:hypothetical protein